MGRKKLITLAKELDFETEEQYFEYCIDSYINGQPQQCEILFDEMKKEDQKRLLDYLYNGVIDGTLDKEIYNFYFNLL